jgi:hypothetical protein
MMAVDPREHGAWWSTKQLKRAGSDCVWTRSTYYRENINKSDLDKKDARTSPLPPTPPQQSPLPAAVVQNTSDARDSNLDPARYTPDTPADEKQSMPHRIEHGGVSPSPIATLPTHLGSPSPSAASSLDRSSVSTPPVGGSISGPGGGRCSPPGPPQQQHHYAAYDMPRGYTGEYMYAPSPPLPAQYCPDPDATMAPPQAGGPGGGSGIHVVYTADAATNLSDRVRRRCFNCCTTDTSTWRRSNLSPGKVVCDFRAFLFGCTMLTTFSFAVVQQMRPLRAHPLASPSRAVPAQPRSSGVKHAEVQAAPAGSGG